MVDLEKIRHHYSTKIENHISNLIWNIPYPERNPTKNNRNKKGNTTNCVLKKENRILDINFNTQEITKNNICDMKEYHSTKNIHCEYKNPADVNLCRIYFHQSIDNTKNYVHLKGSDYSPFHKNQSFMAKDNPIGLLYFGEAGIKNHNQSGLIHNEIVVLSRIHKRILFTFSITSLLSYTIYIVYKQHIFVFVVVILLLFFFHNKQCIFSIQIIVQCLFFSIHYRIHVFFYMIKIF